MKLLAFSLVLLLAGTEAFAVSADSLRTKIICEAGYKFLVVYSTKSGSSPGVTQIFKAVGNAETPAPVKCGE